MPPGETTPSEPIAAPRRRGATARRPAATRPAAAPRGAILEPGDVMEARVAQLWFWEGYYARRGINLEHQYDPEPLQVTDLDLLAFDLDPALNRHKHIGEVKTGTGKNAAKPLDRTIWLRGLRELVGAEHAELTTGIPPSARGRELAVSLGVTAQSVQDVERREQTAKIAEVADLGSQGPAAFVTLKEVHKLCSAEPELERAFWFLRSEVWFLDPWSAAKRTLGLLRTLNKRWTPQVEDDEARALRWLYAEAISSWTLNVVTLAGEAARLDEHTFQARAEERLAEGVVPAAYQRRLSDAIDKYIAGVLAAADTSATVRTEAMGAFLPQPPEWSASFVELVRRLATNAPATRQLPRRLDLLVFERLVNRRELTTTAGNRLSLHADAFGQQRRLLAAFLRTHPGLPEAVDRAMTAAVAQDATQVSATGQVSLSGHAQLTIGGPPTS